MLDVRLELVRALSLLLLYLFTDQKFRQDLSRIRFVSQSHDYYDINCNKALRDHRKLKFLLCKNVYFKMALLWIRMFFKDEEAIILCSASSTFITIYMTNDCPPGVSVR